MINFINNKPLMIIKSYSNLLRNYNYFQYSNTINNNPFNIKHKNFLINNDFINCAKKQNNLNFNKTQKKSFFKKTLILNNTNNKNQNFYEVLGIDRKSSNEQIKQAYLKLAKKYHPDVNKEKDSDENFKNITIAYEALSNQKNRDLYNAANGYENNEKWNNWKDEEEFARQDRARTKQDKYAGGFYRNNYESNFWKGEREDFEEKFYKEYENIFGSGWKESKPQKGEDIMVFSIGNFFLLLFSGNFKIILKNYFT